MAVFPSAEGGTSVPFVKSAVITSAQTSATGSNWVAFASQECGALDLVNTTGTAIEYRRNGAGTGMQLSDGSARLVIGISNADQVEVRRVDVDNAQVTVYAEALT